MNLRGSHSIYDNNGSSNNSNNNNDNNNSHIYEVPKSILETSDFPRNPPSTTRFSSQGLVASCVDYCQMPCWKAQFAGVAFTGNIWEPFLPTKSIEKFHPFAMVII